MKNIQKIAVVISLLFSLTAFAENKQPPTVVHKIEALPRD